MMILMKLKKFLEFFWKEMLYLKFKIMMLQITVSHQLSAAILLLFISAVVGYFGQGSYLER